jgi:hypothetical protein
MFFQSNLNLLFMLVNGRGGQPAALQGITVSISSILCTGRTEINPPLFTLDKLCEI